jgi:hypothetical protein
MAMDMDIQYSLRKFHGERWLFCARASCRALWLCWPSSSFHFESEEGRQDDRLCGRTGLVHTKAKTQTKQPTK